MIFNAPPHPLTNFEIQKYDQDKLKFSSVYSRNNLPYVINLDEYKPIRTHWIVLYVNVANVTFFDSFGVEHVLKGV